MLGYNVDVSVCILTYNQEKYIAQCLESLIQQKTNFTFEIIVGEDCSTDNTRVIIEQYAKQHPDLIKIMFYENNVGAVENIKRVYKEARGKYIAHLDGDDIALPDKLQKQFDILQNNELCNICTHNMVRVNESGENLNDDWVYPEGQYDLVDLCKKMPFFSHSSKMFRNKYDVEYWDRLFCEPTIMDIDVHVEQLSDGYIWHIDENLGVYRVGVGFSYQYKKNIPIMLQGLSRAYDRALKLTKDKKQFEQIRYYYALFFLKYAYLIAVQTQDKKLFRYCFAQSIRIKFIGILQIIGLGLWILPSLSFLFLRLVDKIKRS